VQHIPVELTQRYHGRMVNVHPALLPEFGGAGMYGARVHRAVIASGATRSGPTVHFVDDEYDHGPVIAQWPVPILPGDDDHTLATRVLRAEHLLYPRVVHALAAGEIGLSNDGQVTPSFLRSPLPLFDPDMSDEALAEVVADARR
jgi:folate-dependent phosphoribosylglycinamide formyltransferase PurN